MQKLLKVKETCEYLGVNRRQLNNLIRTGQITSINLGSGERLPRLVFSIYVLDKFLNKSN